MKRNMDLVRRILQDIEDRCDGYNELKVDFNDVSGEEVNYHLKLLVEAELIEVDDVDYTSKEGLEFRPTGLTWEGHEFLEASRSDTLWNKAKNIAMQKTGGLSFDVLKVTLSAIMKQQITNAI